jgi:hypothetical protein
MQCNIEPIHLFHFTCQILGYMLGSQAYVENTKEDLLGRCLEGLEP